MKLWYFVLSKDVTKINLTNTFSDVNNGQSLNMSDCFYVAVGHLKIEM